MKHGDARNWRLEETHQEVSFQRPGGPDVSLRFVAKRESVEERWCEVCNEWVEARGIIGALICHKCGEPWSEKLRGAAK